MEINLKVLKKAGEFLDQTDHAPTLLIILTLSACSNLWCDAAL